ncbi:MAG: sulfotransferase domain-containing protein [Xenococcaceae cyanobacterium]
MNKKLVNRSLKFGRILTSPIRMMPSFLLIGAQKCGTTSLLNYLIEHPYIEAPTKKEIGFFDLRFGKGINWYKSFFPTLLHRLDKQYFITGEASTGYICHPHVPKRISEIIPQVKLIALLRNPVDRAYSHYHHTKSMGKENLSFDEAIEQEEERVSEIKARILKDGNYYHKDYHHYTYLSRGIYVEQLKVWLSLFSKKQILVLRSEDFFANPSATVKQVLNFLELPNQQLKHYKQYNANNYQKMIEPTTRKILVEYFKPHNERLYQLLGINFDWDR